MIIHSRRIFIIWHIKLPVTILKRHSQAVRNTFQDQTIYHVITRLCLTIYKNLKTLEMEKCTGADNQVWQWRRNTPTITKEWSTQIEMSPAHQNFHSAASNVRYLRAQKQTMYLCFVICISILPQFAQASAELNFNKVSCQDGSLLCYHPCTHSFILSIELIKLHLNKK